MSEGDGSVDGLHRPNLPHVHIGVPWGDGLERKLPGARYGIVLLFLLATYIFRASAPTGDWVPLVTVILQGATLLAALAAAKSAPIFAKIAVVVIALGLVGGVLTLFSNTASDRGYVAGLSFLLVVVAPVAIALSIWRRPDIDIQTVLGAICIYILLGMAFAFVFTATGDLGSGPFFTEQTSASSADYQYFSFVTLTTTGYGDLTAAQGFGRAIASIEALTGQLYLVTIVALLVSQLGFRRRDREHGLTDHGQDPDQRVES